MRKIIFGLIAAVTLGWGTQAAAWGDTAHRTICEIALHNLTPAARAEVSRLLGSNPAILGANPLNTEYGWACTYPDHPAAGGPGRRSPEHFLNYSRTSVAITSSSGCLEAPVCVISAVAADFAILRSPSASDTDRGAALVYLGHWLGDIHQPFHNSFRDDLGGNEVGSFGLCTNNLHSTWDTCILQTRALAGRTVEDVRALAAAWSSQATAPQRADWLSLQPWQWSAESFAVTVRPETGYCVMVGQACQYSATQPIWVPAQPGQPGQSRRSVRIDAAYMDWAMPIIQRRITQAGIRLAHFLNLALDPAYRG